jgi:hypothetical protein
MLVPSTAKPTNSSLSILVTSSPPYAVNLDRLRSRSPFFMINQIRTTIRIETPASREQAQVRSFATRKKGRHTRADTSQSPQLPSVRRLDPGRSRSPFFMINQIRTTIRIETPASREQAGPIPRLVKKAWPTGPFFCYSEEGKTHTS